MRHLVLAAVALTALSAVRAQAVTIETFGQSGNANTITAAAAASGTSLIGTDVPVIITQIDAGLPTPIIAFLDLSASSTAAGAELIGGVVVEHFHGSFSLTSTAGAGGTDFLSGTFSDAAITALGATSIAVFAPTASFVSDVIADLGSPSLSFGLTNVTPAVSLVAASGTGSGVTLAPFTASIAGNASAQAIPEPASIALLGVGLIGLGMVRRHAAG